MNRLVAVLLVARAADGMRLKRNQDNKSSLVDDLERDETLPEATKAGNRKQDNRSDNLVVRVGGDEKLPETKEAEQPNKTLIADTPVQRDNRSDSLAEHAERDGKFSATKEAEKLNKTLIADTPLQQTMAPHPAPDSSARTIGMYAAKIVTVSALMFICCAWCLRSDLQSHQHVVATQRSGDRRKTTMETITDRRKTTMGTMIDDQRTPVYLTYWALDGNDPKRPWNPTEQGGTDGVQLALVKDGEVRRIPTDGIYTQYSSPLHKSKEWHHLNTRSIHVVNYIFDTLPSASAANQYREQYGEKELDLRRTVWGSRILAVGTVFEAFHRRGSDSINSSG